LRDFWPNTKSDKQVGLRVTDGGSKVESALRIFAADRALLLVEGVGLAKVHHPK
jgi:hypothetical protein